MREELSSEPSDSTVNLLHFASERLGPESHAYLAEPKVLERALARTEEGAAVEDAVLAEVHPAAAENPEIAGEFVAYFVTDMLRMGSRMLSPDLRKSADTSDLVQSVMGDLWPELSQIEFQTRGKFLSLLARRLDWKAAGRARRLRHRYDHDTVEGDAAEALTAREPGPATKLGAQDEERAILSRLGRLSERDRTLLRLHLAGTPIEEIARATELSVPAAYKAVERARARARELF